MNMKTFLNNKVSRVAHNLRKALEIENDFNNEFCEVDAADIISQSLEKFNDNNTSRSSRVQILTLMPSSWSVQKIIDVMGATKHMVQIAKKIVAEKGILATPAKKLVRF
ncbi:hypothetical protein PV327_011175 [Microctonus hyperodae]|uniref:Uncharacterized protein n=1 Tax=Microctonus hyperodae TaxID=165561 RepID=A0AA39C541_MICHY|nr:hypothetical protein PV327_011175 [Microctonus hyperodae]